MTRSAFPLGRRVHKWRTKAGLDAADVARKAGLEPRVLAEVEEGRESLSAYKFQRLALALGVDPALLLADAPNADPLRSTARFRSVEAEGGLDPADVRLLSLAAEVGRVGASLCRMLGDDRADRLPTAPQALTHEPWKQGYALGEKARADLYPERGPLPSVQGALEAVGVHVAVVEFATWFVEAASLREPGSLPIILLNARSERVVRVRSRRAVLGHELCHLLHDATDQHVVTVVSRATAFHEDVERRANAFGPAFLAPPSWLDTSVEPVEFSRRLVEEWAFSVEGAQWHARNVLGLAERDAASIAMRLQDQGVVERPVQESVRRRTEDASPLVRGLVGDLADLAREREHISPARAREIAALS